MRKLLFALSLVVIAASCKKNEEPDTPENALRNGKWRLTAAKVRIQSDGLDTTMNYFADTIAPLMTRCQYDDYLVFQNNYNGYASAGDWKCTNEQVDEQFTWQFSDGWTKLHVYNAVWHFYTADVDADVIRFDDNTLSLRYVIYTIDTDNPGANTRDTTTYSRTYTRF